MVTINAVNFIDGLDGLAAGVVGIAAFAFFIYSYELTRVVGLPHQTLPALVSAMLAGMCLGFLPHNFYPARIFMGDTGAMLIGLVLAYATISSTANLDPATLQQINRFPLVLPLLIPVGDPGDPVSGSVLAVIRRARAGMSLFAADRGHLHHRMLNIGHSHRLSVLILYLWAALFAFTVVMLSIVGSALAVLSVATVGGMVALLLVSMPWLRSRRPADGRHQADQARPGGVMPHDHVSLREPGTAPGSACHGRAGFRRQRDIVPAGNAPGTVLAPLASRRQRTFRRRGLPSRRPGNRHDLHRAVGIHATDEFSQQDDGFPVPGDARPPTHVNGHARRRCAVRRHRAATAAGGAHGYLRQRSYQELVIPFTNSRPPH